MTADGSTVRVVHDVSPGIDPRIALDLCRKPTSPDRVCVLPAGHRGVCITYSSPWPRSGAK